MKIDQIPKSRPDRFQESSQYSNKLVNPTPYVPIFVILIFKIICLEIIILISQYTFLSSQHIFISLLISYATHIIHFP
jgi:hypothetical protein